MFLFTIKNVASGYTFCHLENCFFHCYSVSFVPLYLSFIFDSMHGHSDSPHFSHFQPVSPHSHADSPQPHSHCILHIPTLIFRISLILLPNSPFELLQIAYSVCNLYEMILGNSCFILKSNTSLYYYCITISTKLLFTSSMTASVLSTKSIYLIVPQVKNL